MIKLSIGTATGIKLWKKIEEIAKGSVFADYWEALNEFVPDNQLVQSKKETFTVEGYNSLFRHFLARLRRKTKCYTKVKNMLIYSAKLLMLQRTGVAILN